MTAAPSLVPMPATLEDIHNRALDLNACGFSFRSNSWSSKTGQNEREDAFVKKLENLSQEYWGMGMPGIVRYPDGRIAFYPEYIQYCVDNTPKALPNDPGYNSFGLGGTISKIEVKDDFENIDGESPIREPTINDFMEVIRLIKEYWRRAVDFSLIPLAPTIDQNRNFHRYSIFELARIMNEELPSNFLKFVEVDHMTSEEVMELPTTSNVHLMCPIYSPMQIDLDVMDSLERSARNNAILGLSTLVEGGISGLVNGFGLLVQTHAEVLFSLTVAQTLAPHTTCIHCGLPFYTEIPMGTKMPRKRTGLVPHNILNAAMARVNIEVTGLPTCQTGGSTHLLNTTREALYHGKRGRSIMRNAVYYTQQYPYVAGIAAGGSHMGSHMVRYAYGTGHNFKTFNMAKFRYELDHEARRRDNCYINVAHDNIADMFDAIERLRQTYPFWEDPHSLAHFHYTLEDDCDYL